MSAAPFSRAAQAYAHMGIAVFPLRPRQKKPLGFSTGLSAASASAELAAMRWAGQAELPIRAPKFEGERLPRRIVATYDCNVACATGAISGFWVLDLDGPEAEEDLAALVAVHGELPDTVQQGTGKGRHLCFAWDPEFEIVNSAGKIGRGIDVRGNGGYIVLPPSIHPGDEAKGIPPGRVYAWTPGKSPRDIAFAPAPRWLLQLVCPPAPAARERRNSKPIERQEGTTKFGRATLATSCRTIADALPGKQQTTLFNYACFIGGYVGGGEIDEREARDALIDAGERMVPGKKPWTRKEIESAVDRGLEKGAAHPKQAEEQRGFRSTERRQPVGQQASAAELAVEIREARRVWDDARPADCRAVRSWFKALGLDPDAIPGGLGSLRAMQRAPLGEGESGPAVLIPLGSGVGGHEWDDAGGVEALAIMPIGGKGRIRGFVGDPRGRVASLSAIPADGTLLVGLDFADVWTLGQNAYENGHELGLILAPTIRTFAGGVLADRFDRVNPNAPYADPENPPWTLPGERAVFLAVRSDLRTGEIRRRRTMGGTERLVLSEDAAARFFGGLAEQAWQRAGANPVRIMRPSHGAGFSQGRV